MVYSIGFKYNKMKKQKKMGGNMKNKKKQKNNEIESARGGVRTHDGRVAWRPALKGRSHSVIRRTEFNYKHEALTTELHEHFQ